MKPEVCEKCGVEIALGTGVFVIYSVGEETLCDDCYEPVTIVYGDRPIE